MGGRGFEGARLSTMAGRVLLGVFGAAEAVVGVWAVAFPRSFYAHFPGRGWHWVMRAGPYDEHLVRDFGGAIAGLAVVALVCALKPAPALVVSMLLGWEIEAVPHFAYHLAHRDLPGTQEVVNLLLLGLAVLVPALSAALLWTGRRSAAPLTTT